MQFRTPTTPGTQAGNFRVWMELDPGAVTLGPTGYPVPGYPSHGAGIPISLSFEVEKVTVPVEQALPGYLGYVTRR
eukprot:3121434-Rhodomonas_salina.1